MDQVGDWLLAQPDIGYGPVLSALGPTLQPFVPAPVRDVADLGKAPANYAVVYLESIQRAADPPLYAAIRQTVPLQTIRIHAIAKLIEPQSRKQPHDILPCRIVQPGINTGQPQPRGSRAAADFLHAQVAASAGMIMQHQMVPDRLSLDVNAVRAVDRVHDVVNPLVSAVVPQRLRFGGGRSAARHLTPSL